jgi:hypothetical protein
MQTDKDEVMRGTEFILLDLGLANPGEYHVCGAQTRGQDANHGRIGRHRKCSVVYVPYLPLPSSRMVRSGRAVTALSMCLVGHTGISTPHGTSLQLKHTMLTRESMLFHPRN